MSIDFRAKQAEFAAYIRDPDNHRPPADVDPQRMAMYHELFFNNIDSTLSSNFPVLRKILSEPQWLRLTQHFYANHRCRTPHFSEIAEEFLDYLQNRNSPEDYPFLLELAHYEWVEMALSIATARVSLADSAFIEALPQPQIRLSPLAWPLAYQFPVQRISPEFLPETAPEQPTYLIVYRDQADEVHFLHSTALIFRLLQILEEHQNISGVACLQQLAAETPHLDPELLFTEGVKIFRDLASKGIVIPADNA